MLSVYPKTLKGDMDLLEKGNLTFNQGNILHILISEKKAYISLIETSERIQEILSMKKDDAVELIKRKETPRHMQNYLETTILPLL